MHLAIVMLLAKLSYLWYQIDIKTSYLVTLTNKAASICGLIYMSYVRVLMIFPLVRFEFWRLVQTNMTSTEFYPFPFPPSSIPPFSYPWSILVYPVSPFESCRLIIPLHPAMFGGRCGYCISSLSLLALSAARGRPSYCLLTLCHLCYLLWLRPLTLSHKHTALIRRSTLSCALALQLYLCTQKLDKVTVKCLYQPCMVACKIFFSCSPRCQ